MSWKACLTEIERAVGRKLSDDELDDLLSELQRRAEAKRLAGQVDDANAAIKEAADDYAKEMVEAAILEKRNAAINLKKRIEAVDFVRSNFADNPVHGIEAVLIGVNRPVPGGRLSAAAGQKELAKKYLSGLITDLSVKDNWRVFVSGAMDREIARAMWARNRDQPFPVDVPREAIDIADALTKWQEVARQDANKAGAWVKRMPGYIVRQSHNLYRIRRAGFDTWREFIESRLDWARIAEDNPDVNPQAFLKGAYEGLASGVHLKHQPAQTGFSGPRNIAKKMSAERVLHFKSADDWIDYNQQFGVRSLSFAAIKGLELSAQNTGLMRVLGTNPEANLRAIGKEVLKSIESPAQRQALDKALRPRGRLADQLAQLDGTTRVPVNAMGAYLAAGFRAIENMSKLGGAVLSQFSDMPLNAMEMRYQGQNFLQALGQGFAALGRGMRGTQRQELFRAVGVVADTMRGDVMSRHSIAHDDLPGALAWAQQFFFKANFMLPWTDRLRAGTMLAMANRLAEHRRVEWDKLNPDLKRILSTYGMQRTEWDVIRSVASKEVDGRHYVTPEALADVPDDRLVPILAERGQKATAARLAELREDIASKLRTYYTDRGDIAVSIPDVGTQAIWARGTQPGTVEGELLRFIGQFKSFPTGVVRMHMGREMFGRGAKTYGEAFRNGNGEMLGMAQLLLSTMAFGYLAMSAKDLAKGRAPRDPLEPKTWAAAMVQGGGAGIYGDFLFGELRTRFGGGALSTALGPAAGTFERLLDIAGRMRAGDDVAAAAFRTLQASMPFANMFYTRIALDYLFMWSIQEALNPGSLRRLESRVEKENAQRFLVRPSRHRVRAFE